MGDPAAGKVTIKLGDKVKLTVVVEGGKMLLTDIQPAQ